MAFSPRDLVDRDLKQVAEPILGGEQLSADALNHPPDRVPVDPRQPAGRGLVGLRRQPRDQVLKIAREPGVGTGERDALDQRAVLGATQPPQPSVDLQAPNPEIEMAPDRVVMLAALAITRRELALRATKTTTAQRDRDHDAIGLEADLADPHPGQGK